ncbi:MAG: glycosyltransferase family 4 protein [Acidimicrobiales bacterium]|nr:glycosyltransferase family 4 protein [Acidimicrobiales bacterium]
MAGPRTTYVRCCRATSPRSGDGLPTSAPLRAVVDDHNPDVLLAHGGQAAQVAAFALWRRAQTAIVWQRILDFPPELWKPGRRQYWRLIVRRVDAVVALTADEAKEMGALRFAKPVWTIPNFRQPSRFMSVDRAAAAARLRREIGIDDGAPLVGFVGHLVHQKRPVRAVSVLELVRQAEGVDAHLVIAGSGPKRELVEQEIERRGLTGHVTILGHRDDIEQVFAGIDLAILVSSTEGIPGVAIEAAMAGCPLASYPVGGIREVVDHGRTGVVLDESDVGTMATEVAALLRDDGRRSAMSDAARLRHAIHFSAERIAHRYNEVLVAATSARRDHDERSTGFMAALHRRLGG